MTTESSTALFDAGGVSSPLQRLLRQGEASSKVLKSVASADLHLREVRGALGSHHSIQRNPSRPKNPFASDDQSSFTLSFLSFSCFNSRIFVHSHSHCCRCYCYFTLFLSLSLSQQLDSNEMSAQEEGAKEQDKYLPIANIARIMKKALPPNAKVAKDAKETVQECVSEFISFITSEVSDRGEGRKR